MLIMMATIFVGLAYILQNEAVVYLFFLAVNPNIRLVVMAQLFCKMLKI